MPMAGDNDKNKKGFSGLSDLASEVSGIDEPTKPEPKAEAKPSMPKQPPQPQRKAPPSEPERKTTSSPPPIETVSSGKSGGGSGGKWILGIIGVIFVIWLINNGGQSDKKPSYTPPSSSQSYSSPQSIPAPAVQTPRTTQTAGLQYTKPSVGTENVLSVPEIRWCIREGMRIETMREHIDTNAGIDEFNLIVNDYNSRCGSYRYRQGSRSRAEQDVEAYRSQIISEAIRDAKQLGSRSYPSISLDASISNAPKKPNAQHTREAQQLLTDLGYDPGPVDGDCSRRTANAVKAFQRDVGITQDGWIDQDLLSTLRTIREKLLKTKAKSADSPAKRQTLAPTTTPSEQPVVAARGTIAASERAQIENYCERVTSTPDDKNNCIERELWTLRQSGGKPDLSGIPQAERQQIEGYCSRVTSTPGDEYNCILRELRTLRQSGGKPDLSSISRSERAQIENYCSRVNSTPGDEYNCIDRELKNLKQSGGRPDLSSISSSERSQIEGYCRRVTSTPGDEYNCIDRELKNLKQSGGRPDLSSISSSERSQIEGYCRRVTSTPGDEYNCIDRELKNLKQSGGRPDLSGISQSERSKIEGYCGRVTSTPGDEYNCLCREMNQLRTNRY
jgi:peptidoglycan hydrolase-like protein with peptidoglycan-binding domain